VLDEKYVLVARAKGVSQFKLIKNHVLRNAFNPILTALSGWFAALLAGAFFVEFIFLLTLWSICCTAFWIRE